MYNVVPLPDTQEIAFDLLAPSGCLVTVIPLAKAEYSKRVVRVFGDTYSPAENRVIAVSLYKALHGLLAEGAIRVSSQFIEIMTCLMYILLAESGRCPSRWT